MITIINRLFGTRKRINHIKEFIIDDIMPSTIAGLDHKDILKVKGYLERLRVGQSIILNLSSNMQFVKLPTNNFLITKSH